MWWFFLQNVFLVTSQVIYVIQIPVDVYAPPWLKVRPVNDALLERGLLIDIKVANIAPVIQRDQSRNNVIWILASVDVLKVSRGINVTDAALDITTFHIAGLVIVTAKEQNLLNVTIEQIHVLVI